jgi:S-layer protein (TIGR01567 family)
MKRGILLAISIVWLSILIANVAGAADGFEVRGQVTNLGVNQFTWDNSTFAGFYYDVDKNLGAETLTFSLSDSTPSSTILSDQPFANDYNRGVVYQTVAQPKNFNFKQWGQYNVIGFLGEACFASYDNTVTQSMKDHKESVAYLHDNSQNENLMTDEQISKVLIDDNTEQAVTSSNPLKLKEGYVLSLKSVDATANTAILELTKNSEVIDSKVVAPSRVNATMSDKTYYYKADIGSTANIIQIAVHFKNAFHASDQNLATVDGVFQLSDKPISIKPNQQYDKMSIRNVDATSQIITMDNKDNQITLSKNKDIVLMQNIHIRTANQDRIDADNPLRFYIYKLVTAEPKTTNEGTSATNSTIPKKEETIGVQKPSTATINEGF